MLRRFATLTLLTLLCTAVPAAAQNACDAGKLKCARNKLDCLIKVHEAARKTGLAPDAVKLQKCMAKFDGGTTPAKGCFAALEAKFGAACSTTGNTAAIEAQIDADVAALLAALAGGSSSSTAATSSSTTTSSSSTTTTTVSLAQGAPCATAEQCQTGFCVDGVCCDSACTGTCRSCSGVWNVAGAGVCSEIDGGDPENDCAGTAICCLGACQSLSLCLL
jgi:hypothetical protein